MSTNIYTDTDADRLSEILDEAVSRQARQESSPNLPAELQPLMAMAAQLAVLQPVELPDSADLVADRQLFLAQVAQYRQWQPAVPVVVPLGWADWLRHRLTAVRQALQPSALLNKEPKMSPLIVRFALVLILAFGSVGGTAVAAANSLPDSPLYPLKLQLETARLALNNDPTAEAELHLVMAQTRVQEMVQLTEQGGVPGEATLTRLQTHLQTALQLAAQAPDENMNGILTQAQTMARTQTQAMEQAQTNASGAAEAALGNAWQMMNQFGQDVDDGLASPATFRWRHSTNRPADAPEQPEMIPPGPGGVITHTQPISAPHGVRPIDPGNGIPADNGNQASPGNETAPGNSNSPNGPIGEPAGEPAGNTEQNQNQYEPGPYGPGPDQPGPGESACSVEDAECNGTTAPNGDGNPPDETPPADGKDNHRNNQNQNGGNGGK